jgi:hypothetical protein
MPQSGHKSGHQLCEEGRIGSAATGDAGGRPPQRTLHGEAAWKGGFTAGDRGRKAACEGAVGVRGVVPPQLHLAANRAWGDWFHRGGRGRKAACEGCGGRGGRPPQPASRGEPAWGGLGSLRGLRPKGRLRGLWGTRGSSPTASISRRTGPGGIGSTAGFAAGRPHRGVWGRPPTVNTGWEGGPKGRRTRVVCDAWPGKDGGICRARRRGAQVAGETSRARAGRLERELTARRPAAGPAAPQDRL